MPEISGFQKQGLFFLPVALWVGWACCGGLGWALDGGLGLGLPHASPVFPETAYPGDDSHVRGGNAGVGRDICDVT